MHFSPAFVLAALPFLTAALPAPEPKGLRIPLAKRDTMLHADGTVNRETLKANIRTSIAKLHRGLTAYERNMGSAHPLAKMMTMPKPQMERRQANNSGADPLTDDNGTLWYGTISVGTPAKQFTVDFDTGSSDLFLPGPDCNITCSGHNVYDPKASSSSQDVGKDFKLAYGDGSTVSGKQFTDVVSISGLSASKQTLGAADTYSSGFLSPRFPADGLMGLAFPSISVYGANPYFQTLMANKELADDVFSFKLSPAGAELFIGGSNNDLFTGDLTYVPVTKEGYWQIDMGAVTVNGKNIFNTSSTSAIVDTGTTLIVGDTQSVQNAYSSISGSHDNGDGTWTIPCDAKPSISVALGGKTFNIDPSTFVLSAGSNECVGGISSDDKIAGQFWILGDAFLQNVYTVFDVGKSRVGFAALSGSNSSAPDSPPTDPASTPSASVAGETNTATVVASTAVPSTSTLIEPTPCPTPASAPGDTSTGTAVASTADPSASTDIEPTPCPTSASVPGETSTDTVVISTAVPTASVSIEPTASGPDSSYPTPSSSEMPEPTPSDVSSCDEMSGDDYGY